MNFQIGPWLFVPYKCMLCSNTTGDIELEPILFKLLTYFVNNQEKIISRQELIEHVWQQSFVDDNAINRAMSELRKKLSHPDNSAPLIKTHYRKGYSITVDVIAIPIIETTVTNKQGNSTLNSGEYDASEIKDKSRAKGIQSRVILMVLCSLLFIVGGYHVFTYIQGSASNQHQVKKHNKPESTVKVKENSNSSLHTIQGVTWNSGQEFRPIVSSDNLLFAYNNRAEPNITSFVKRKSDLKEVQLIYKDLDVTSLSWQQGTHNLLAEVTNYQDECFIGLFDLSSFTDNPPVTKLKSCDKEMYGGAHLASNGNKLYLIELDQVKQGGQVVVFDLKAKKSTLLIPSGDTQFGITRLKLSPDNTKLLYMRHERDQPFTVHMMDLITRENKTLHQSSMAGAPLDFAWFPDSQHLAIQIIESLTIFNLDGKSVASYPINVADWIIGLAIEDTSNVLIALAPNPNLEVVQLSELFSQHTSAKITSLVKSDSMNYYLTKGHNNAKASYFVSNRTENLQIWRKQGQQVEQVTFFPKQEIKKIGSLILSPDEKSLLYLRGNELEILDLTTKTTKKIDMATQGAIGSYQWHQDQQKIYYDMAHEGIRQIWSTDLTTNVQTQLTTTGGRMLIKNQQHQLYYINDDILHQLNSQTKHQITIPIAHCWCSVSITDNALYSLDSSNSLYKMSLATGDVEHITIPIRTSGIKMVNDHTAIAAKYNNAPSQIKRVSWQSPLITHH
ncbi:winged helix-turn-helix domain-containing protein [Thalassotalea sediminis]|uniref:winged helix-turn-helix domain-containing protein n=1 Tax=Thalassotalea sediminis TaxID=1759089 RepID=UPI0025730F53|nr:winged helix-turn-helix domain-containing protein [Thalassotalea sediminis]